LEAKLNPYLSSLEYPIEEGEIPNLTLRNYFHKYDSEEEFHYQGKTYSNFKDYGIGVAGGTSIQGTKFTPGIPNYMQLVGARP
jgi:hypothetical protein